MNHRYRRLGLEALESRNLLAVWTWSGAPGGDGSTFLDVDNWTREPATDDTLDSVDIAKILKDATATIGEAATVGELHVNDGDVTLNVISDFTVVGDVRVAESADASLVIKSLMGPSVLTTQSSAADTFTVGSPAGAMSNTKGSFTVQGFLFR